MIPSAVVDALKLLAGLVAIPGAGAALVTWWKGPRLESTLSPEACAAANVLDRALPTLTRSSSGPGELAVFFNELAGDVLLAWCSANAARRDARLAPLLNAAATHEVFADVAAVLARDRVLEGPLVDALQCAPLAAPGALLMDPALAQVRARLEILLWEAGASAQSMPELGPWLWGSKATFEAVVGNFARGTLRGRVVAARCLEVSAKGMSPTTDPELVGRTLQVLQPLLLHPEPLVWIHAARALGRLAGVLPMLEGTLLDWLRSESVLLRQRAVAAFASQPGDRLKVLAGELVSILDDESQEGWVLAACAAATPYLFFERKDLWDRLAARVLAGDGGSTAARALARGLATLWRRGTQPSAVEVPLRQLRDMARVARADTVAEWRHWLEVIALTDRLDGAERDPLDLEQGLENLVRLAAQYDDEEGDARASRFAEALASTFTEARRVALEPGRARRRAAGLNAVEGIARSMALQLWGPLLATRPTGDPLPEPSLEQTWRLLATASEDVLDVLAERRREGQNDPDMDESLEVLALRIGGYTLDACGEEPELGPGRGPTAHQTCLWLRKLHGLADGSRDLPDSVRSALSSLFWRLVDTTRGTALGEVDDVAWLGPFAAWWALVIDRPAMLQQLASALPMIAPGVLEQCCALADTIRGALLGDGTSVAEGQWLEVVEQALIDLQADDTELSHALVGLARALSRFATAGGAKPGLEELALELVVSAERLRASLADPVRALHLSTPDATVAPEGAPRIAAQVARAIRARELSPVGVWFTSLGPMASALVEFAVQGAVRRTPPAPPQPKREGPQMIEGYELVKALGEGGVGTVWLVRKPGADRLFVLKIPKADALADANEEERKGILDSFVEEAKALAGLYHPNVANIIDRGVSKGVPFLVLEYLIGADLKAYAGARLMTFYELRQVVSEVCAGLSSLHSAGLVHRDLKPANLWLRLPLQGGEIFDPDKHRDPARTPPLSTVVIDFGMVRAMRVSKEAMGRFVAGTPGYIAPEQVLDPMELDGRADVYALAGTIYNVTTGRTFFDDLHAPRERVIAHMQRDPFEDIERLRPFPAPLARLLRAATAKDPHDRPTAQQFGREFSALF